LGPEGDRPGRPTQAVKHTWNLGIVKLLRYIRSNKFKIAPHKQKSGWIHSRKIIIRSIIFLHSWNHINRFNPLTLPESSRACCTLNYLAFQSFDFERTWWRLFQKWTVRTKFDIYVFITSFRFGFWKDRDFLHCYADFMVICQIKEICKVTWVIFLLDHSALGWLSWYPYFQFFRGKLWYYIRLLVNESNLCRWQWVLD
jgi:hypothetical protein